MITAWWRLKKWLNPLVVNDNEDDEITRVVNRRNEGNENDLEWKAKELWKHAIKFFKGSPPPLDIDIIIPWKSISSLSTLVTWKQSQLFPASFTTAICLPCYLFTPLTCLCLMSTWICGNFYEIFFSSVYSYEKRVMKILNFSKNLTHERFFYIEKSFLDNFYHKITFKLQNTFNSWIQSKSFPSFIFTKRFILFDVLIQNKIVHTLQISLLC